MSGRVVPTVAGWWWILDRSPHAKPSLAMVEEFSQFLAWREGIGWKPLPDVDAEWLAPIPGPEVCAALAGWFAAWEADDREAGHDYERWDAESDLIAAIRAERDGAA